MGHLYQFDFDLYQCSQCERHWVRAWREGTGGWEDIGTVDATTLATIDEADLRPFMKKWAVDFH